MRELDPIELTQPADGYPAGTPGTIVETSPPGFYLVEIAEEALRADNDDIVLVTVRADAVRAA